MSQYFFTQEHESFRKSLRDFLKKEVIPNIDIWEKEQQIPKSIWKKFGEMGYIGLGMPEKYGGIEVDFFYNVIYIEEVSKVFSGGFSAAATATPSTLVFNGENKITLSAWVNFANTTGARTIIEKSFGTANNQVPYHLGRNTNQFRSRTFTDTDVAAGRAPDNVTAPNVSTGT
jgi:hypothetical protein